MYWYHAHPDGRTGEQVYRGLAGLFIVEDEQEASLGLPAGAFDRALAIQDRSFDARNQLVYLTSPMDRMRGFLGDRILVNGQPDFILRVAAAAYRLRLLNASNSRIYRLAWDDGASLMVIGTDGGLLEMPTSMPYVMLAPGERVELWADFGPNSSGDERTLVSLPVDGMTAIAPLGPGRVALGRASPIFKVKVDRPSSGRGRLPARLTTIERHRFADAVNATAPRRIQATMHHMGFGLNGRTFEMNAVAADEHGKLGTLEAWEFDNSSQGRMGMMGMMGPLPHPFHIHGGQFQVIRREGVAHAGYVDGGWKDTVLVMPGERATVLMRYLDYAGIYLYHCHNLEHEDGGMMRNFAIDP
jgi:FtsP/CotA-like multicopper oxidase with cupredoxin domain